MSNVHRLLLNRLRVPTAGLSRPRKAHGHKSTDLATRSGILLGVGTQFSTDLSLNPERRLVAAQRHYANAPITEGLIDIRVAVPSEFNLGSLDPFCERVRGEFPSREDRSLFEGLFTPGKQPEASAKQTKIGYLFRSGDGKYVLQARLDGFTFSRLKPYENWMVLRDEAKRLWEIYREIVRPSQVTRVAVRYINQIDIPLPIFELKDYFRTYPEVSPELAQDLSALLMQLQIPQKDLQALLVLTQTGVPPPSPDVASVILDIDLFIERSDFKSDDEIWEVFEAFRARKNEVFEGCITDKTRQLFGLLPE